MPGLGKQLLQKTSQLNRPRDRLGYGYSCLQTQNMYPHPEPPTVGFVPHSMKSLKEEDIQKGGDTVQCILQTVLLSHRSPQYQDSLSDCGALFQPTPINCRRSLRLKFKFRGFIQVLKLFIGFFTYQGSKQQPQGWIQTPVQCEPDDGWYQKLWSDGRDLCVGWCEVT